MSIMYREYKANDKPGIIRLIKALYFEDPEGKPISIDKIERTLKELHPSNDKGSILIIEDSGKIIGYSILINFWSNEYGGNILFIDELYIIPKYRGKGIGAGFIKYLVENRYGNSAAISLEITPSNTRAGELYKRIGFKVSCNTHFLYELDK